MENATKKTEVEELREDIATLRNDLAKVAERVKNIALTAPVEWGKDHFAATVGVAAGAGFLLGLLLRGRRR